MSVRGLLFSILFCFLGIFSIPTQAGNTTANQCHRLVPESTKLLRILNSSAASRFEGSEDQTFRDLADQIAFCQSEYCVLNLTSNSFRLIANLEINSSTARLKIQSLEVFEPSKDNPSIRVSMPFGKRPDHLSLVFVNLVGAIFAGLINLVDENPKIEMVEIIGQNVVNSDLANTLLELGFQPLPRHNANDWILKLPLQQKN